MFWKYICSNFQCEIYVFGVSSNGICPGCQSEGIKTTEDQGREFLSWYRRIS